LVASSFFDRSYNLLVSFLSSVRQQKYLPLVSVHQATGDFGRAGSFKRENLKSLFQPNSTGVLGNHHRLHCAF